MASLTGTVRATVGRRPMRLGAHLAAWLLASLAHAQSPPAELAGTYATETPQGRIVVRIEVTAGRLAGTLDAPGSRRIILSGTTLGRYALGTMSSGVDTGEFEALLDGATLDLRLSQRAQTVPLRLQRVDPTAAAPPPARAPAPSPGSPATGGAGDARLVGAWSGQTLITSGDASMASEEFLVFRADGSYTRGSGRAVAGGSGWSYEGGAGPAEQGRWRTEDGVLFLAGAQGPWRRIGRYGMTEDGQTMRITYDRGGRKLWTRR